MKTALVFLLLCLNSSLVFAQNTTHPTPLQFTYKSIFSGSDTTAPLSTKQFPQKEFVRGWQWGGRDKITDAMHSNMHSGGYYPPKESYTASKKINVIPSIDGNISVGLSTLTASYQFEPTLKIVNVGQLNYREHDKERSIFGFGKILGETIITDTNNVNFNRLVLKPTGSYKDSIVLKNAWFMQPYRLADSNTSAYQAINGQHYFLTLNLRRLDTSSNRESDSVVLSIRMPYRLKDDPTNSLHYVKFCGLPDTNQVLRLDANGFRGHAYDTMLIAPANQTTTFTITQNMLPKANDSVGPDITISAYMNFDGQIANNHKFIFYKPVPDAGDINSIDIEVTYKGVDSIAIDYIRIENPAAQKLFRGEHDTLGAYSFQKSVQKMILALDTMPNLRFFRLYGHSGEDSPIPWRWGALKYMNSLLGGLVTASIPQAFGANYAYYTEAAERWTSHLAPATGTSIGVAAPFLSPRNEHISSDSLPYGYHYYGYGAGSGYRGYPGYWDFYAGAANPATVQGDSLNSFYETWLTGWGGNSGYSGWNWISNTDTTILTKLRADTLPAYFNALQLYTQAFQAKWELQLYNNFAHPESAPFLYQDQPWWSQFFIVSNWNYYKSKKIGATKVDRGYTGLVRPPTGEETRLAGFTAVAMGAKGIAIDRLSSYDIAADTTNPTAWANMSSGMFTAIGVTNENTGIHDTSSLSGLAYLRSNHLGSDFLEHNETTHLDQYVNIDTIAYWMQVRPDRVFLGRKSQRLELTKLYTWIDAFNDTLMHLRLVGWFSKGFKDWGNWDTARYDTVNILSKFIKADSATVRKLYEPRTKSTQTANERRDSTFYHVTVLSHQDDPTMKNGYYLSLINRRTDPLIRPFDTLTGVVDSSMKFYTTAEFDEFVHTGGYRIDGVWKDSTYWRDQWWKRLGCREISLPFNYKDSNGYALLHIKELGVGNHYLDSIYPDRKDTFLHPMIDTVIGQDRTLAIKFLPGEGKMFKVEILHPDTTLSGILSYTNQRKLVGFPKKGNSDSMYYHLTYHKPIPGTSRSGVYYRRSEAIRTNSSTQNIIWQKEILVSKSIRLRKGQNDTIASSNCAYPALVVRYDSSSLTNKVFVVYSCEDEDTCFYSKRKRIVETILPADDSSQTFNWPQKAETLSTFYGSLDEYGTPMINASDSGNYYCWADSLLGIVAGWKHPDSTYLEDSKNISYRISIGEIPKGCQHPSLNSYSRLKLGENDCALVWQEKFDTDGDYAAQNRILYTRLKMVNGNLTSYLPPTLTSANGVHVISSPGDIAWLSDAGGFYSSHYIPSVYREVLDTAISPSQQLDFRSDCVAWHTTTINESGPSIDYTLSRRILIIHDTTGVPNTWWSEGLTEIWSTTSNLYNISQSQGEISLQFIGSYIGNGSSRSHIMTFTETPKSGYGILPNHLMQIQSGLLLAPTLMGLSTLMTNDNAFTIDYVGKNGQTAALPRMISEVDWRKNRRVYEGASVGSLRRIQASAMLFMKQGEEVEPTAFTGFGDRSSKFMLSNPMLNGKMLTLERVKRLRGEAGNFGSRHGFTDTLETNWFTVGDEANLMLKSIGKNAGLVSAFVERRSDGERFAVQLRTSDDTTALWTRIPLLRGGVEEYRFFMVKNTERNGEVLPNIPNYGEEIILGGLKTRISANKGNGDIQAIDLGRDAGVQASIRVYPNPAQDKVSVVVLGSNPKDVWHIKVMNVLGHVISEHEDKTSSLLEIVTEDYPSGVYYITAESGRLNATARFVIMK
ncbi:MAG: T9SS type A sorting domain-containing protein [Candidatus Kapaibacterium sp.]